MGSSISKIADEIALHGSYEAYEEFRDKKAKEEDIPYFPDPEVVPHIQQRPAPNFPPGGAINRGGLKKIFDLYDESLSDEDYSNGLDDLINSIKTRTMK